LQLAVGVPPTHCPFEHVPPVAQDVLQVPVFNGVPGTHVPEASHLPGWQGLLPTEQVVFTATGVPP